MVKITRPKVSGIVLRERLFHAINICRRQRPVLWLCGPAGSGKTTLVSSYVHAAKLPCVWYQLDERDRDIASFFTALGEAVKNACPTMQKPLPVLTPEYHLGIPAFAKDYFEEACSHLKRHSVLIFDNYQTVPVDSPLHQVMAAGFSVLPENVNVIVISRGEPGPHFIRFRANSQMDLMGWDQIRFTLAELKEVVSRKLSGTLLDMDAATLERLHAKSDGWIAGIVLMLHTILTDGFDAAWEGESATSGVFDYFASELLAEASEEVRTFLLKSSFSPVLSVCIARNLTGIENAGRILEEFSSEHYFTTKHTGKEPTYQFHPLFKDFLQHQAKTAFSAEQRSLFKKNTANVLLSDGQTEDAALLFIEIQDWDKVKEIVISAAPALVEQGRYITIRHWLNALPRDTIEGSGWLLYWKGICSLLFSPRESQSRFEEAFQQFRACKDAVGLFLSICGVLESIQYAFEDFHQLDGWIITLSSLLQEWEGFPSAEIEARTAAVVVRGLVFRMPLHPDFESWRKRACLDTDVNSRTQTLAQLAWHYASRGYVAEFQFVMNDLRQLVESGDATPFGLIWMKVIEHAAQDICGYCVHAAQEGLEIAEKSGIHIADLLFWANDAVVSFNRSDIASASSSIHKMSLVSEHLPPWDRAFYQFLLSQQAYSRGDLQQAKMRVELAVQGHDAVGVPFSRIWARHLNAVILAELGEHEKADELLEQARSIGLETGSILSQYEYCLFKAKFCVDRGHEKEMLCYLQEGLRIGKKHQIYGVYSSLLPSAMARLAVIALENRIEVEHVQELIRRRRLVPPEPPVHVETWPWPLKIFVLGDFRIEKDGNPAIFSGKLQRKPLAILKAIIAFGEKSVSEEQIKDLLWPNLDGDAAHAAFKMALSRLRKLIGINDAVRFHDGRLMLDPYLCWVDAWAFERTARKADDRAEDIDLHVAALEKALSFYKGALLPSDSEQPWTVPMREHLRGRHLSVAHALAHHLEKHGNDEKAATLCENTLDVDHLAEDFYRQLMACYQRLGRGADAVRTYERCRKTLAAEIGVAPSPETKALYAFISGKTRAEI
ncbi:MAG: BTAD domain-containing putative transcriptional regulator [Terracidiphilus sp.]|jgi:LuxR family transcriptional regulator, maltose regulon positive regulatory protein